MEKMISCKSCGKEIASSAKTCPSCGAKNKKQFYTRWWFWVIIVIILLAIIGKGNEPTNSSTTQIKTETEKTVEKSQEIDYRIIYSDYEKNPISADAKYKDKYWQVTGTVGQIDREIMGNPFVTFEIDFLKNIRLTFAKSEEEKISKLEKGQTIAVVGKCNGTLLSTSVAFDDCHLVE